MDVTNKIKTAKLIVSRLGRISVDSTLAHRASGIRGSLLKILDLPHEELSINQREQLDELLIQASNYLKQACIEKFV